MAYDLKYEFKIPYFLNELNSITIIENIKRAQEMKSHIPARPSETKQNIIDSISLKIEFNNGMQITFNTKYNTLPPVVFAILYYIWEYTKYYADTDRAYIYRLLFDLIEVKFIKMKFIFDKNKYMIKYSDKFTIKNSVKSYLESSIHNYIKIDYIDVEKPRIEFLKQYSI